MRKRRRHKTAKCFCASCVNHSKWSPVICRFVMIWRLLNQNRSPQPDKTQNILTNDQVWALSKAKLIKLQVFAEPISMSHKTVIQFDETLVRGDFKSDISTLRNGFKAEWVLHAKPVIAKNKHLAFKHHHASPRLNFRIFFDTEWFHLSQVSISRCAKRDNPSSTSSDRTGPKALNMYLWDARKTWWS